MSNAIDELLDLLNNIEIDTRCYVYFDSDTGKIHKIGPKQPDSNLSCITVSPKEVEDAMEGRTALEKYEVIFDPILKEFKVTTNLELDNDHVYNTLHEVPREVKSNEYVKNHTSDIVITQDNISKSWKIKISNELKDALSEENARIKTTLDFSVTSKHDPNILYKYFSFNINELFLSKTATKVYDRSNYELDPAYEGIFVDIWYNELPHLSGQHVFYDNAVYRIKEDQSADTDFNNENVDILVENVKLLADSNSNIKIDKPNAGDIVLKFNHLYIAKQVFKDYEAYKEIPYTEDFEFNNTEVSIFTPKYFDSYTHEVINE